jgi:hypothetical protein
MRYLFLIYNCETVRATAPASEHEHCLQEHRALLKETGQRGILLGAAPLHPTSTARTVRREDGRPLVVDGPFAETKEQLGGFYILDCASMDEAVDWAAKIPTVGRRGCVEIRPMASLPVA